MSPKSCDLVISMTAFQKLFCIVITSSQSVKVSQSQNKIIAKSSQRTKLLPKAVKEQNYCQKQSLALNPGL
jgi:hypothetical protein